ncbi:MAG: transglutaminase-like domain-containing protein [Rhodothermales bacterium]|nr:transglutaminase-like domain-containing protein [Rhodothermales bacterium]
MMVFIFVFSSLGGCNESVHDRAATRASLDDRSTDVLAFYSEQSPTTDPGRHAALFDDIRGDVRHIVDAVQRVLVRPEVAERESSSFSQRRTRRHVNTPIVEEMLSEIIRADGRSLTERRSVEDRFVAICAQYAMLTASLLRYHNIPARARGGFETHISETKHHDHWITEYWDQQSGQWFRVDAEIEGLATVAGSETQFDAFDVPHDAFATGAEAWRRCRKEGVSPDRYGIAGDGWYGGWDFVLNELLLDFNALNRVESLPWDNTVVSRRGYNRLSAEDLRLLDDVAEAVLNVNRDFSRVRDLFRLHPQLRKGD